MIFSAYSLHTSVQSFTASYQEDLNKFSNVRGFKMNNSSAKN